MVQACPQTIVMPRLFVLELQTTNNEIQLCQSVVSNTFASPALRHRHVCFQPAKYAQAMLQHPSRKQLSTSIAPTEPPGSQNS